MLAGGVTTGGFVSRTTTRVDAVAVAPWLSVTVSVTSWVPSDIVAAIDAVVPSVTAPSVHLNVIGSPTSGSEPVPASVTSAPAADVASTT